MPDYVYPSFDLVLKNNSYTFLNDGSHSVINVVLGNKSIVYKSFNYDVSSQTKKYIKKFLLALESPLRKLYFDKWENTFRGHIDVASSDELLNIEYATLEAWKKRNIPCMQILEKQDNALIYAHYNAKNFHKLMHDQAYPNVPYTQLLDTIYKIRTAAKIENDSSLLHSDMLPQNFLYLFDENKTLAIDPGLKLKNLPFEELDARINLFFIYRILNSKNSKGYINGFLETLNKDEISHIRELNTPLDKTVITYFSVRTKIADLLRNQQRDKRNAFISNYTSINTQHINDLLDAHLN